MSRFDQGTGSADFIAPCTSGACVSNTVIKQSCQRSQYVSTSASEGKSCAKQYLRSSRNSGISILCSLRVGGARTHFFVCTAKVILARTVKWSRMVDGTTVHVDTEFSVERTKSMVLPWGQRGVILAGDSMWIVRL